MYMDNNSLIVLPKGVETRWASPENLKAEKGKAARKNGGRKGSAFLTLKAGEQLNLAEETGVSGTIRRIWMTIGDRSPKMLRSLRLDFYWDEEKKPAVSAPLGDFFGTGLGRMVPFESILFSSPEGKSFNCFIPMPFKKGMKIVIINESDTDLDSIFYDINYTIGDQHPEDVLYFHAYYHRENPTTLKKDYSILPKVLGKGRFLGSNIGVIANQELYSKSWWGEGECKIFLDGDKEYPTLCGTGTEDYIGTAWGQSQYNNLYQGCHIADTENMRYCFYRYHIVDPVYFTRDIRITIQQIGCWEPKYKKVFHEARHPIYKAGPEMVEIDFSDNSNIESYGTFERKDDWSSCAYFYLDLPVNNLPQIDAVNKRVEGLL